MRNLALLLLLGALRGCLLQNIRVSQIPAVSATEGSTVTLQCHYTLSSTENGTLGWYRWYRQSPVQNEFINNRSVSIQLHRVQISDTGMYICEVTLGLNKTLQGHWNGTFLNVVGEILNDIMKLLEGIPRIWHNWL
uniref:Natural cytotoxicity triggering receptor 3 n=1 Tax=Xenopus tropicalis TaxID=8364 RepID=A0A1B8XYZ6_XENTR